MVASEILRESRQAIPYGGLLIWEWGWLELAFNRNSDCKHIDPTLVETRRFMMLSLISALSPSAGSLIQWYMPSNPISGKGIEWLDCYLQHLPFPHELILFSILQGSWNYMSVLPTFSQVILSRTLWGSWTHGFSVSPISLITGNNLHVLHEASMTFPDFQFKQLLIWKERGFPGGVSGKESAYQCRRCKREMWIWSLGGEDPLEKEMGTHSSILA